MFRGWYVVGGAFLVAVWAWGLAFYGLASRTMRRMQVRA